MADGNRERFRAGGREGREGERRNGRKERRKNGRGGGLRNGREGKGGYIFRYLSCPYSASFLLRLSIRWVNMINKKEKGLT